MIFVSVGTHEQPFDRLLREIDSLIENGTIRDRVFAQTGHSAYIPKKYKYKNFLDLNEFDKNIKKCTLFITHAGEGNIGTGLQFEKKMIVIPRRKKFGEHTNDHQLELAQAIKKEGQAIVIESEKEIKSAIKNAWSLKTKKTMHAKSIISEIEKFISKEMIK
jgi:UDP-N-acetylglucosamine transferase subunit ALG13